MRTELIKRTLAGIGAFLSAAAFVALLYALADSLISGLWPQFNGVMVYRFAEFFPRSLGIYFIFLLPLAALGLPLYFISKRLPGLRKREIKPVYNSIGAAASLIIPVILFEIPNKLALSYFEPVFVIADFIGLLLIAVITVYFAPLLLSLAEARLPRFLRTSGKIASYLSLVLVVATLFSLTILPEITRAPYNPEAPNILVISIDALRKDHLSYYGYDKIETPNIDAFLESGTSFDNAYCSSPWTLPSLGSFLTGYQPSVCGVDLRNKMSDDMVTLAEILRNNGYRTECYNTNHAMLPEYGFGRGFDKYMQKDDIESFLPFYGVRLYGYSKIIYATIPFWLGSYRQETEFNSTMTINAIKEKGHRPFFVWCHFLDPHTEYRVPEKYIPEYLGIPAETTAAFRDREIEMRGVKWDYSRKNSTLLKILYDGEIRYVDEHFGFILESLKEFGHDRDTVIVIFNDHGEEFWDHGKFGHGYSVYPELSNMVLGYRDPNISSQLPTSNKYVTHIDILPSVLNSLGIEISDSIQGRSFYPELTCYGGRQDPVLTEYVSASEKEVKGVRSNGYLLSRVIEDNGYELYNIKEDPNAEYNLYGLLPEVESGLSRDLELMINDNEKLRSKFFDERGLDLTEGKLRSLKALGYLGE